MKGFAGSVLHVDLTAGKCEIENPSEDFYRTYMGGGAMNMAYLSKMLKPGTDPLGPDNVLCLSIGPATGFAVSGQSRVSANALSPLTGAIGDAQGGGFWPADLKKSGFDGLVITGRSEKPVYLWLAEGKAEIRDASAMKGKTTGEAEALIRKDLDEPKVRVLQIGPAGENMARMSAIISSRTRACGRTGMGAVMGSKNLRAVVVKATDKPQAADPQGIKALAAQGAREFPESMVFGMGRFGTAGGTSAQSQGGGLPTRNFSAGWFAGVDNITGGTMYKKVLKGAAEGKQDKEGRDTCYGCVIRCKRVVEIQDGPYKVDPAYGGPEYETVASLGSYCGVDDLSVVCKANELCNAYGLDTISAGGTIAWAMEAFEAGVLTTEDTGGLEIRFGDGAMMLRLLEMMTRREGFGDLLAEGSAAVAAKLGRGFEFLTTSKGQEAPAHMPHAKRSLGLIYAVNPFGADHMSSEHDPGYEDGYPYYRERLTLLGLTSPTAHNDMGPEKVRFVRKTQQFYSALDSLCVCQFVWGPTWQLYGPQDLVALVRAATGWDVDVEELRLVGERRINMMRIVNARMGLDSGYDTLPDKFYDQPLSGGATDGVHLDREIMDRARTEYYRQCGWDETTGVPSAATLVELGLGELAAD